MQSLPNSSRDPIGWHGAKEGQSLVFDQSIIVSDYRPGPGNAQQLYHSVILAIWYAVILVGLVLVVKYGLRLPPWSEVVGRLVN